MKKGIAILLGIMLLAGCSSNDADEVETKTASVNETVESEEMLESSDGVTEEAEDTKVDGEDSNTADTKDIAITNDHLKDFPEFDILTEKIDLTVYKGVVETDNKGTRVILFEDERGHKEYKSIFVKHDNRLKIVQFKDDGLLYNEIVK